MIELIIESPKKWITELKSKNKKTSYKEDRLLVAQGIWAVVISELIWKTEKFSLLQGHWNPKQWYPLKVLALLKDVLEFSPNLWKSSIQNLFG